MMPIFDAHLHIIDPAYPLWQSDGYLPPAFTVEQYCQRIAHLNIVSGAVVSGSFQRFDQTYLVAALTKLGKDFVGVTQLPVETSDQIILELNAQGVRALRFNIKRGGSEVVSELDYFARRVHELVGWHVELYADHRALNELKDQLIRLPAVSIDHLGLEREGLPLLELLVSHNVKVKATGFGRLDFHPWTVLKKLHHINPEALLFGTDLPSTRAPEPFVDQHLERLIDVLGEVDARKVCWTNARAFYGLSSAEPMAHWGNFEPEKN